jgi:hypothetical protein
VYVELSFNIIIFFKRSFNIMLRGIHEKLYFGKDADASGGLGKGVSDFNKGVSSAY